MPSSKPAIAVRLPQHVFDVFARLAELQGRSKGSVVAEILEAVYPPLMRTVALLEAAAEAPKQVRESLVGVLEDIERDLVKTAGGSLAQMDWLVEELRGPSAARDAPAGAPAPKARAGSREGSKGGLTPVPVTRGSGLDVRTPSGARKPRSGRS